MSDLMQEGGEVTKRDAVKVRQTPGRLLGLSWGTLCAGYLLALVALVWVFAHYRHVDYRTEFRELLPLLSFAVGVLTICCVCGLYLRHRARRAADREVGSARTAREQR